MYVTYKVVSGAVITNGFVLFGFVLFALSLADAYAASNQMPFLKLALPQNDQATWEHLSEVNKCFGRGLALLMNVVKENIKIAASTNDTPRKVSWESSETYPKQ